MSKPLLPVNISSSMILFFKTHALGNISFSNSRTVEIFSDKISVGIQQNTRSTADRADARGRQAGLLSGVESLETSNWL